MLPAIVAMVCVVPVSQCVTQRPHWKNLDQTARSTLLEGQQQTQFALIGSISTPNGKYKVAVQRIVTTGMLSPRGQSKLMLFDQKGTLAASYSIINGLPLWCEGSRIYLWGSNGLMTNVPVDARILEIYPNSAEGGNVIDFSKGLRQPVITREKKYGSSGGIEDDPWKK